MTVDLYPLPSGWSFIPNLAHPTRVRVPRGSKLLKSRLFGLELLVPAPGDHRQRIAWSAQMVYDAAESYDVRFHFANSATGPLATRCAG